MRSNASKRVRGEGFGRPQPEEPVDHRAPDMARYDATRAGEFLCTAAGARAAGQQGDRQVGEGSDGT